MVNSIAGGIRSADETRLEAMAKRVGFKWMGFQRDGMCALVDPWSQRGIGIEPSSMDERFLADILNLLRSYCPTCRKRLVAYKPEGDGPEEWRCDTCEIGRTA